VLTLLPGGVCFVTDGGANNESAEEFFARVQDVTNTIVLWPSRLKVGAKSKKGKFLGVGEFYWKMILFPSCTN